MRGSHAGSGARLFRCRCRFIAQSLLRGCSALAALTAVFAYGCTDRDATAPTFASSTSEYSRLSPSRVSANLSGGDQLPPSFTIDVPISDEHLGTGGPISGGTYDYPTVVTISASGSTTETTPSGTRTIPPEGYWGGDFLYQCYGYIYLATTGTGHEGGWHPNCWDHVTTKTIRLKGTVTAGIYQTWIGQSNAKYSGSMHATVTPYPVTVGISPSEVTVVQGDSQRVSFTLLLPTYVGEVTTPYQVLSWSYAGDDVSECAGSKVCSFIPLVPGTVTVQAIVNGGVYTRTAEVRVRCKTSIPQLGDSVMKTLLDSLWKLSNADDPNRSARLEQAGYYYKDPITGESTFRINIDYSGADHDACNSWPGVPLSDWDPTGILPVHTHPFSHKERLPLTNCKGHTGGYLFPGPSGPDFKFLTDNPGLPAGAVMDKDNVYRFKPDSTWDTLQRKQKQCTYP